MKFVGKFGDTKIGKILDYLTHSLYESDLSEYLNDLYLFKHAGPSEYTRVYDRDIEIIEVPKAYLPSFVLGMTDRNKIWVREGMNYLLKKFVIAHERAHIRNWYEKDENKIDEMALGELGWNYAPV